MPKMRALVRQPAAVVVLLVLLGVTAHAASITVFTSLDEFQAFQAQLGLPQQVFNFDDQPEGPPDVPGQLSLDGLTIAGPFQITAGAVNFSFAPNTALGFAYNFNGNNAFAFGTDITALSRAGTLNFSVNGLSALINITSPGFVGFGIVDGRTFAPFRAINATFEPFPGDTATAANFVIDNIIVNAVPGPATLVLLAAGGAFVLARRYTRRRTVARGHGTHEGDASDPM